MISNVTTHGTAFWTTCGLEMLVTNHSHMSVAFPSRLGRAQKRYALPQCLVYVSLVGSTPS